MVRFPGLELFVKQLDYDEAKTPGENLKALSAALEGKKALRQASFRRLTFGVERARGEAVPPGRVTGEMETPEHWRFPTQFEELAGADNFIAVVHADGNGMGRRVERIYEGCTDWEDCCRALRSFSQGVQADFETAFRQTVETVIASGYAPDRLPSARWCWRGTTCALSPPGTSAWSAPGCSCRSCPPWRTAVSRGSPMPPAPGWPWSTRSIPSIGPMTWRRSCAPAPSVLGRRSTARAGCPPWTGTSSSAS